MADDENPSEDRLEELEEDIQKARTKAEEAVSGLGAEPKETYADSGTEGRDEDDQTIVPPG